MEDFLQARSIGAKRQRLRSQIDDHFQILRGEFFFPITDEIIKQLIHPHDAELQFRLGRLQLGEA